MWELSSHTRSAALGEMGARPLDMLVVGGGITGAGVVLDAALRGLRVGLVEARDFAFGTSSRSSKMVHGGLRYLATGDVRLVREALRERRSLQQRAAHLVKPLPMLLPVYGWKVPLQRVRIGTGLWMYDLLGAWRAGVRHSWLGLGETIRQVPNIQTAGLVGGLQYRDSQADDFRLVMAVLRTALGHGALIANGARVERLLERNGRVCGAEVRAEGRSAPLEIEAGVVVNATGVWSDRLHADGAAQATFELVPSKGIHLMVDRDRVGIESGVAFFSQTGNSNVFIEPWAEDLAIIGTSDTPYSGDLDSPVAAADEVAVLLGAVNRFLREPLSADDVIATWAGLRPLVVERSKRRLGARRSKDMSRRHRTIVSPGLVTLVGGKLTTYRAMAQDGVDAAVAQLGRPVPGCTTYAVPLEGSALVTSAAAIDELSDSLGVDRSIARSLLRRYGDRIDVIRQLCDERPDLRERLHPERPYIAAEVVYASRYEMARSVEDVLERRTRLAIETRDGGRAASATIEAILAGEQRGS